MKRTTFPEFKVDAILTSDWHMMPREINPPCRTDNHFNAQTKKVKEISKLQKKYDCPVFNAGDFFEHWKASPELVNHCFRIFPKKLKGIPGQHDLPQHSMDLIHKSSFESLVRGNKIEFLFGQGHWGANKSKLSYLPYKGRLIIILHMLVWKDVEPYPESLDPRVNKVFKMFPDADLIITGDNHLTFTARKGNQLLINPGSLTRHKADQVDHRPCIFLWNAKKNTFKTHYLKIRKNVISRDHIDIIKAKEERGEAFISSLNNDWLSGLSYEHNMKKAIRANKLAKAITKHIYKWMGR